ncbi:uncharacterized protein LOC127715063 isoform X1 [Mytilus californianus]|uniref:uncharacterized protein LOC127715063 isoform X1 n=1 Tax=Mytilus californianus TaxID=6549 RepID=UPI00224751F3|nr:uncharacterized protein LOC127715063 isoform X1 [Mytilus californianus]
MTDHITQNVSKELYCYMCQNIVGTEEHVKQIRLFNAARDSLLIDEYQTSGSFGEGLMMRGSDLDIMSVRRNIEVYDVKPRLNQHTTYLSIDTDDVKPGFTQLRLEVCRSQNVFANCVQFAGKFYLSNTLWKQRFVEHIGKDLVFHGPCISDKHGTHDFAECLHCKTWVSPAIHWITRSNTSWPGYDVKQSIIRHGVLFVPIGVKGSSKEDLEWRISFSIGEKLLINSFTHTQLVCYALMKILLKDVIATYPECKELLCSYFLKTIVFWISEELPKSSWKPDNLIPCFMQCFSRLIYCVEFSVCLHYFIPENNMFENKIEGRARKVLLKKLHTLHSYGWRCILFSDQVNNVAASMQFFYMEQNQLHVSNITKITNSHLFQASNFCFRLGFNAKKISLSSSLKRIIQKAVSVDKSSIKYVYTYYMSTLCAFCAQSIPIDSAYRNNKYRYRQYKSCLCTLLQNIYHDAVSGWLMIASFFYKTKQYSKSLRIIMYSLSKCTVEKLFRFMKMSDSHYGLLKLKLFQKKSIVNLWKLILVDNIKFDKSSLLIPDELLKEVEGREFVVPSTAYAYFLNVLCHYHLNNVRKCRDILQDLQCVIDEKYLMKNLSMIAVSYNLLGVALQILGDTESARQAFLQSVELNKYPSRIFAVKRLLLMS